MVSGLESIQLATLVLVVVAGFAAGWVDAVVGGGGLIQLPVMLLVPGISPVQALATNKMGSIFGTTTSTVTYYRRVRPDLRTAVPMAVIALARQLRRRGGGGQPAGERLQADHRCSAGRRRTVHGVPAERGRVDQLRHDGHRHYVVACLIGAVIGFYDGMIGPGTGSFLIIALVSAMGYAFLEASAKAKSSTWPPTRCPDVFPAPRLAALGLGLVLGAANMAGGYLGARTAVSRGSKFIRIVFLVVVGALIIKLGSDVWQDVFG